VRDGTRELLDPPSRGVAVREDETAL
jgi:hypothetical protein